jgi:hypothetical protein
VESGLIRKEMAVTDTTTMMDDATIDPVAGDSIDQKELAERLLVTRSPDPTGEGRARWVIRWKPALNACAITFAGRFEKTT